VTPPRELVAAVRRLDEAQLRRLAILVRGLLETSPGPRIELEDVAGMPKVTYRQCAIRCGKDCAACPHGPYWYAYWKEGGRGRSQYIGRELPAEVAELLREADRAQA
jgi:hypothetical protein